MISPAAAELIRRCREQIANGFQCDARGEYEMARVWFRAGIASMDALEAQLNAPSQKPLRKLVVVMPREEEAEPEWFARKANDNGGDGAA